MNKVVFLFLLIFTGISAFAQLLFPTKQSIYNAPLKTEIRSEIKDGLVLLAIHTKIPHKQSSRTFLYNIEVSGQPKYSDSSTCILSISLPENTVDTSFIIPIALTKLDSTSADRLKISFKYRQSYIAANWLFFKKYDWMLVTYNTDIIIEPSDNIAQCVARGPLVRTCRWWNPAPPSIKLPKRPLFDNVNDFVRKTTTGVY